MTKSSSQESAVANHEQAYDNAPWQKLYPNVTSNDEEQGTFGRLAGRYANIPEMVSEASQTYRAQRAFTTCMPNGMSGSLTFAQIDAMSDAFAVYLRDVLGLEAGARVAVQMPNCLSMPVAAFGVMKAGCVLVNMNPLYTEREMEHQLNDSGAQAIVLVDILADKLENVLAKTGVKHVVLTSVGKWFPPIVRKIIHLTLKYWNRTLPDHKLSFVEIGDAIEQGKSKAKDTALRAKSYYQDLKLDDIALLQYTGGTTGVAKGAILTHGSLLSNLEQVNSLVGEHVDRGKECILTALPMYHIFAFSINLLMFYRVGAHNILVPNPRPIQNCQRAFDNYPISWISGVNTLYNALLNEEWFALYPPTRMKVAMAGGTALHKAVAERWRKMVNRPIIEGYGLTESSPVLAFNRIGHEQPDSIGIPIPGTQVRIVDDEGRAVPVGQPGEIIAKGPQVMQGYWNRPDETEKTLKDGWLYTGDVAYMTEDGHIYIVDRKKDMILVSGFNVYPNEIEDCIARIPEVQESAVIGLPDPKTGESVCAYVVLREEGLGAKDVIAHCKKELAAYKVPKKVVFREDLPKTPVGKVLRKELRSEANQKNAPEKE